MSVILLIETATPICSTAICRDGQLVIMKEATEKNAHSSILSVLIEEMIKESGISYKELDAIAVSSGPGSYTGLRIGVSTAKGLCYALEIPLISIGTLESMAKGAIIKHTDFDGLFCPMIDARRMEVYSAIYNKRMEIMKPVSADIITDESYSQVLVSNKIMFFGDGAEKTLSVFQGRANILFDFDFVQSSQNMISLAEEKFKQNLFEDIAYFEPFYLKDFVAGKPSVKGLH